MDLYQGYEDDKSVVGAPEDTVFSNYEEFEAYKSSVEYVIAQAKAAERLSKNKDFIDIIMTAYMDEEPVRLARLIASGRLTKDSVEGCVQDLESIGNLNAFLQQFIAKGNIAVEELAGLEEAREQAILDSEQE